MRPPTPNYQQLPPFILIPLAAWLAVLPILLTGPSCGHDFDFHLLSWLEASSQFAHLHYPHWAYTPAWNAGEPRFLFYPPLSWTLGAVLGLLLPWSVVPAAFTFIALTLCGLTAHRLASRFAGPHAATFAAILYLLNPYMLFTAYERTAYGELLAAAWLPLLFLAALQPRIRIGPLAIPIALLWLTNAPAAVMSCYALAALTMLRLCLPAVAWESSGFPNASHPFRHGEAPRYLALTPRLESARLHLALGTAAATVLGLLLPAFYLLPAAYERKDIQSGMAMVEGMRIADNTLFHHMSPETADTLLHDEVLHTASLVALLLLLAVTLTALLSRRRRTLPLAAPLLLLALLIALLLTPLSLPIWAHTPQLRFLQFPWRLTALLGTIFLIFASQALSRLNLNYAKTLSLALPAACLLIPLSWRAFHQPCNLEDNVPGRLALFHSHLGTEPTDEYTPASADNDSLAHVDPPFWLSAASDGQPDLPCDTPPPAATAPGQAPTHLILDLQTRKILVLNRRNFPLWQIRVNGKLTASCERDDGLIAVALPRGHNVIDLSEHHTPDQTLGLVLTGLSAAALFLLERRRLSFRVSS